MVQWQVTEVPNLPGQQGQGMVQQQGMVRGQGRVKSQVLEAPNFPG